MNQTQIADMIRKALKSDPNGPGMTQDNTPVSRGGDPSIDALIRLSILGITATAIVAIIALIAMPAG